MSPNWEAFDESRSGLWQFPTVSRRITVTWHFERLPERFHTASQTAIKLPLTIAQGGRNALPQPKLKRWFLNWNSNIAGWQGVVFLWRELLKSFAQRELHTQHCSDPKETKNTTKIYTTLSGVEKGQDFQISPKWGRGLLASDTSETTCAPKGSGLFPSFLLWRRIHCCPTDLPLLLHRK